MAFWDLLVVGICCFFHHFLTYDSMLPSYPVYGFIWAYKKSFVTLYPLMSHYKWPLVYFVFYPYILAFCPLSSDLWLHFVDISLNIQFLSTLHSFLCKLLGNKWLLTVNLYLAFSIWKGICWNLISQNCMEQFQLISSMGFTKVFYWVKSPWSSM